MGERHFDSDARRWLERLADGAIGRAETLASLHALLLRAARFAVAHRRLRLPYLRGGEAEDIACQAADTALARILVRLDGYRGESSFTTWACKFALLEAAAELRKRAWQAREVPLQPSTWMTIGSVSPGPDEHAEQAEVVAALRQAVETVLTSYQRQVFVALALNGVPIDVLAETLGTTRGALYKTLHTARRRLRAHLTAAGLGLDSWAGSRR